MEKKTSYAEFSSQLNDKNIVVIEFGRQYTRCGFAGEPAPRAIIKTLVTNQTNGQQVFLHNIRDKTTLRTCLADFIEKIYFNHLAVSPSEKKVAVVESVFCKSVFRNTLTRVLFEQFNVPSILFVPDHLMALATLGRPTGLIVDIGAEEAISFAVVNGVTLLDCTQFASLGAHTLDALIADELIASNPSLTDRSLPPGTVEDIRIKTCFVAPFSRGQKMTHDKLEKSKAIQIEALRSEEQNREKSLKRTQDHHFLSDEDDGSPIGVEYSIGGQRTISIPGNLREGACEIFFEIFAYEHSLTTIIMETILSAPIDCRRPLGENILVIGGLANLPGLEHRLAEELENFDRHRRKATETEPHKFQFHKAICPKNYVSWLGASMFCSPSSIELRATTRDQWLRDGKKNLKDWSDWCSLTQ